MVSEMVARHGIGGGGISRLCQFGPVARRPAVFLPARSPTQLFALPRDEVRHKGNVHRHRGRLEPGRAYVEARTEVCKSSVVIPTLAGLGVYAGHRKTRSQPAAGSLSSRIWEALKFLCKGIIALFSSHLRDADATPATYSADGRLQRCKGPLELTTAKHLQRFFCLEDRHFWDYTVHPRNYFLGRQWLARDWGRAIVLGLFHVGALAAPFFFTWKAFACFLVLYPVTAMLGITCCYHRLLSHRSFKVPKILEYTLALCGVMALQGHPIDWVSDHRHHHARTESELDVHSPLDGFWWSHMGWIFDYQGGWIRQSCSNVSDLRSQYFYRFVAKHWFWLCAGLPACALYAFGGLPCLFWGLFFRVVWVWHITFAVNSICHMLGSKDWDTPDNSMNNWLIGALAFGEGWHNNHHAFEGSCRHGLKWWQVDITWYFIKLLEFLGLASDLKYPTESKMRRLAFV